MENIKYVLVLLLFISCKPEKQQINSQSVQAKLTRSIPTATSAKENSVKSRFKPPLGFIRKQLNPNSYEEFLRTLPLKPTGTRVKYFNGYEKANNAIYDAVIDLPIGDKDLHQCADAIMRLRAEYLWNQKQFDQIHFNFTNGFRVDYSEWMKGRRIVVEGNTTYWNNRSSPSNTYNDFWTYMEQIFMFAGTASLERELETVPITDAKIGDILIRGGHPGHAVVILDACVRENTGEKLYLLAQSYMPAQEIQILKNPMDGKLSPWYALGETDIITPEWVFQSNQLKRF